MGHAACLEECAENTLLSLQPLKPIAAAHDP